MNRSKGDSKKASDSYRLVRSNRKTVAIQVEPDGAVVVRAPRRLSVADIDGLVASKCAWIAQKRELVQQRAETYPALELKTGEQLPFLGQRLTLVWSDSVREIMQEGSMLAIPRRLQGQGEAALRRWYRAQALEKLSARTAVLAAYVGIDYTAVTVTDARRRWGSCGADGRIHFAWRLIMAEPAAIDYVIIHELCHRRELNHSPAFWAHVASILPGWREQEEWLREHNALLRLL